MNNSSIENKMTIPITQELKHYILPKSQKEEVSIHVGHYKHGKREKKMYDVSPSRRSPLGLCLTLG